ncbi:unnamed protein product [Spodoptera littoralis]|uniref:Peripheral-type benzodiazepine receptor n=1 Tax=Spodoptera littoralis TaxID=7109 RepID=A0A9P0N1Q7_SPOLI|nr:unnamed protein product [Spodoptera littoralis]CAH1641382.1 unnamed protein product [Spodoptera littoralis]
MADSSVQDFVMANWPALGSIVLPNVGGWVNGLYFAGQVRKDGNEKAWYDGLKKPSWNPPKKRRHHILMCFNVFTDEAVLPLTLYGGQLLLNWAWTPIFFGLKDFKLAFIEITVLSGAALATTLSFFPISHKAGFLMLPYLAWLGYASSLSYYIWKNNPKVEVREIKDEKAQ